MRTAYLLIGGNMGNRLAYLQQASDEIEASCGIITRRSAVYETEAWGLTDQPSFYNQALALESFFEPPLLMNELLGIEERMGRKRDIKMGPRIIDIDILLIDDLVMDTPKLSVPHPALALRRFALAPLAQIAAELVHPVLHKTIRQLLDECPDRLHVQKK
ncbi:2-amino-4-hydroxy-6-hydroxymethyldihydropteridine diphosphokinase [Asinibacterium sp. OR53]|uniref:2-amino-4-hydroxy-6- hydroxymethyldihydropteridine diphosphokinase n=1 Tax=Asinibacterium sp. OR53 TaxID=925409 RepID=UPI00047EE80C|nr:2-amino-4-hydroxy-6-hydroxymethyldihydropteridine diphosphokinase [Asinibacterium sp. OR53]